MFTFITRPPPEECVYNLIEQTVDDRSRGPPIYRSRFSCRVKQDALCAKTGCYKTMGVPKLCLCPPNNFLKKHSRAPISVQTTEPRIKVVNHDDGPCPCSEEPKQPGAPEEQAPCEAGADAGVQDQGPLGGGPCCESEIPAQPDCSGPDPATCCQVTPCGRRRVPRLCCNSQKPPVHNRCVQVKCCEDPKNYIHSNVVKALRMPPRKPAARFVYNPKGDTREWDNSGLPRKYVWKDTFGCVPAYIHCIKDQLCKDDMQAKCDMKFKERDIQSQIRHLEPTEHQAILCGLKLNWDAKFAEFQRLPLLIDTAGKIAKKKQLEIELKELEKDIQVLERHDHLFVSDTCRSFYLA